MALRPRMVSLGASAVRRRAEVFVLSQGRSLMGRAGPLIAARLISAVVSLSIPLVLARTMAIAEYGTYKQLFLLSVTISAVVPLGMSQSLYFFIPRTTERRACFTQTLLFLVLVGSLGGLALYLCGSWIASALTNPGLLEHRLELALYTGLLVASYPLEISMTTQGLTRRAAVTYLASDFFKAAALVIPSATGLGLHWMMWGMVTWAALRLLASWVSMVASTRGPLWDRGLLRQQLAYALPFGAAIAVAIPQQYAHQFIVAHAVGPALFAVYAVAVFELPFVDLFYTPTGEVLMVQLGELEAAGRRTEGAGAFRDAVDRLGILLLPPIFFIWAVAPAFITTMFGDRFASASSIFRLCLFAMPLAILPIDATLRARGETRHILISYVLKALVTIPLAWIGVARFGLAGAAGSYVIAEFLGRAFLAWKVPASLSTADTRIHGRDLIPGKHLLRTVGAAVVLALAGAGTLRLALGIDLVASAPLVRRVLPLGLAGAVFGAGYLSLLAVTHAQLPGFLGAILARRRARRAVPVA